MSLTLILVAGLLGLRWPTTRTGALPPPGMVAQVEWSGDAPTEMVMDTRTNCVIRILAGAAVTAKTATMNPGAVKTVAPRASTAGDGVLPSDPACGGQGCGAATKVGGPCGRRWRRLPRRAMQS